jgi:hypothetical protein
MGTTLEPRLLDQFERGISGPVLSPEHPGYDETRAVHNGLVDRRPALIVRARTSGDVVAALGMARDAGLEVSVGGAATTSRGARSLTVE